MCLARKVENENPGGRASVVSRLNRWLTVYNPGLRTNRPGLRFGGPPSARYTEHSWCHFAQLRWENPQSPLLHADVVT